MNKLNLSEEDITSLSHGQSVEIKSSTIKKVAHYYTSQGNLSARGKQLAEDIFRIMVQDVEVKVREIMAESIKNAILITIVAIIVIALALGIIIGIPLLIGHRYNLSWWWIVLMIIGMIVNIVYYIIKYSN